MKFKKSTIYLTLVILLSPALVPFIFIGGGFVALKTMWQLSVQFLKMLKQSESDCHICRHVFPFSQYCSACGPKCKWCAADKDHQMKELGYKK